MSNIGIDQLAEMAGLLYDNGVLMDGVGCSEPNHDACFEKALEIANGKRVRSVKDWQWWDLSDVTSEHAFQYGAIPAVIYAGRILRDTSNPNGEPQRCRTSPIVMLHENIFVETQNSIYMLVGPGTRKSTTVRMVMSIV